MKQLKVYLGEMRIGESLLAFLVLLQLIPGIGFLFGRSVGGWEFWVAVALVAAETGLGSWRRSVIFLVGLAVSLLLAAYSFTYVNWDVASCHFPAAYAIQGGWNPVYETDPVAIDAAFGHGTTAYLHILYGTKFAAVLSAVTAAAFGLMDMAAFSGFVALFALALTTFRFAQIEWSCGRFVSCAFAAGCCFYAPRFFMMLEGCPDYLFYATGLIGFFSVVSWLRTREVHDLAIAWLGFLLSALTRFQGLAFLVLLALVVLVVGWRKKALWWSVAAVALLFVVAGWSPYMTNPYPLPVDLGVDFVSDADGEKMGWLSRVVYMWFSKDLAVLGCRLWHGMDKLVPGMFVVFTRPLDGNGSVFRFLMCLSVLLLALSRERRIVLSVSVLFLVSNMVPVKFIGFERYFPLLYPIPGIAIMTFVYGGNRCNWLAGRWFRSLAVALLTGWALLSVVRCIEAFDNQLADEGVRQQQYAAVLRTASGSVRFVSQHNPRFAFTIAQRLRAEGFQLTDNPLSPKIKFRDPPFAFPKIKDPELAPLHDQVNANRDAYWSVFRFWRYCHVSIPWPHVLHCAQMGK